MKPTYLESYVVPICLFRFENNAATLIKSAGTAFFVGSKGLYITARHVVEAAQAEASALDAEIGLNVKANDGQDLKNVMIGLGNTEHAPQPYDITIGLTKYAGKSPLRIGHFEAGLWQEVSAIGYPASATVLEDGALWINTRGHKGYVQRLTVPRDMHIGSHPNGFELSFLLSPGMSGCPIFDSNDQTLIGVGVGSFKSELVEEQITEVLDNGQKYLEQRLRIEQFGFAHDIRGLHDWKPQIFNGATLLQVANT